MTATLGILGVGHLASYVVAGLRNARDDRKIILSPRNQQRQQMLVKSYGCEGANSNQEVVDTADILLLCVRPQQLENLLESVKFSPGQLVVSCIAGVPLAQLQRQLRDQTVVRTMPLACAEVGQGAVPVYPSNAQATELLRRLGTLVELNSEAEFELATVAACMNGWMFSYFDHLTHWYQNQGLEPAKARELVLASVNGAVALAIARPERGLGAISDSIATDGTYTKLGLDLLQQRGAFEPWSEACDAVEAALTPAHPSA